MARFRWIRGAAIFIAMLAMLDSRPFAPPVHAIAGIEGTFEYAIDAPWRIEPAAIRNGSPIYGPIPIQISIHDAIFVGRDPDYVRDLTDLSLGRVCSIEVRERAPGDPPGAPPTGASRLYHLSDLQEVEYTRGLWPRPGDPTIPEHALCKAWSGQDCTGFDRVSGSLEWHGLLSHLPVGAQPGTILSLQVEVRVAKDPSSSCEIIPADNLVRLTNETSVYVAPLALPRFGAGWLYGDLHYHSQGTDNEGESAYNYRGVLRAMSALGMDFAFANEHASNSEQIVDVDVTIGVLDGIDIFQAHHGVRDMSHTRYRFLHDLLNLGGGANADAAIVTSAGDAEPAARLRPVPQIFLGGEVDLIPELPPGTQFRDLVPWGNGQLWDTDNLCVGTLVDLGPLVISCDSLNIHLLEQTATNPDSVLVDDIQGFIVDFARHHVVYLPRSAADRESFVPSNTGDYGGASRRFVELRPEFESHGSFFAAHPLSHFERGNDFLTDFGPNDIPWTDHLWNQVWPSPAFLGLQFWNEDARLREDVAAWDATTVTDPEYPLATAGFCSLPIPIIGGGVEYICPTPGDDVGYERHDAHAVLVPQARVPVHNAQTGFGTGVFHLDVEAPVSGRFERFVYLVEEQLHHGAFTWDRLNHWGLDPRKTLALPWLPSFLAPRRLFMAGGSDAHGDLNYRRTGYLIRNEKINDAALGKPRNLVQVGAPAGPLLPRGGSLAPVAVHSQEQVSEALADGRFSITDGPALRIAVDLDHDGVIDDGEPTMGDVVTLDPTRSLPLLVEWKSTPEFGPVTRIDLYVGARSSQVDLGSSEHAIGRTYAPPIPGVFHDSIPGVVDGMPTPDPVVEAPPYNRMNDNYWEDPTGSLRFAPGNGFGGTRSVALDLRQFPVMQNLPADRFFVRAFAITAPRDAGCDPQIETGGCLTRFAFTNPIWATENSYLCSTETGLDTVAPAASCNVPPTISRQSLPLSFTATAVDLCGARISFGNFQCYAEHANGTTTPRQCVTVAAGDTVTVERAEGTSTIVSWDLTATDPAGNSTTIGCRTETENEP